MLKRMITLPLSLAAAAGVPFVALNQELKTQLISAVSNLSGGEESDQASHELGDEYATVPSPFSSGAPTSGVGWNQGGSSAGAPFLLTSGGSNSQGYGRTNQRNSDSNYSPSTPPASSHSAGRLVSERTQGLASLPEGWPTVPTLGSDLRQVIRFDVTPNWIKANWPRVSVGWTEDGLEGFRVPLVTGTQVNDLTGALTYYFDAEHRVQRIRFVGNTGDASELVDLCTRYFEMRIEPTRIAGFYVRRYHGRPVNVLRVTHEAVIHAERPNQQLNLVMELNNPAGEYELSQATVELLSLDPPVID
ncbi:MAG: hypothetical protein KDA83_17250 [Planctomycetales bacterium]|nr:hypothetical protein [Planctomycetales bacterium]